MSRPHTLHHAEHDWTRNHGFRPGSDPLVRVTYACGHVSPEAHLASWWTNWSLTGMPFDIASYQVIATGEDLPA